VEERLGCGMTPIDRSMHPFTRGMVRERILHHAGVFINRGTHLFMGYTCAGRFSASLRSMTKVVQDNMANALLAGEETKRRAQKQDSF